MNISASLVQSPFMPLTESPIAAGFDCGNGGVKLSLENSEIYMPSHIRVVESGEVSPPKDGGMVHYVDGDRQDLIGQTWLTGKAAELGGECIRVVDDIDRKAEFALQFLLGALSRLPHRDRWVLWVAASAHNEWLKPRIHEALAGSHVVTFNATSRLSEVVVKVAQVFDETAGVIAVCPLAADCEAVAVLDIGCGTTQAVQYGSDGRRLNRINAKPNSGVNWIIDAIANSPELMARLDGEAAATTVIRAGIDDGSFCYGKRRKIDFRDLFNAKLEQWLLTCVRPVLNAIRPWRDTSDVVIAVGGGLLLPDVADAIAELGIEVSPSPVFENSRGLKRLAELLLEV